MTGGVECGCVPGHRMMVLDSRCADCGLSEREVEEGGNRPCDQRWKLCPIGSCNRHHKCMYLNHPRCPYGP